jgi:hypothetical protein
MDRTIVRRARAGLLAALIALLMLFSALPASADSSKGDRSHPGGGNSAQNVTWE